MTNYALLIFPILLVITAFIGCDIAGKGEFASNFWDVKQAHMMQAISCVFIILHHLTQSISGYGSLYIGPITILSSMGILFTSIFFFFSGYGLITSFNNNPDYLKNFISHRFPIILVPFFVSNLIYVLVHYFYIGTPMSFADVLRCILGLVLMNGNGWYIVEIFFLYLAFYFLFKYIKKQSLAAILLNIFTLLIIYKGYVSGHDFVSIENYTYVSLGNHWFKGEWWYNSTIVFIFGIWAAKYKNKIFAFSKKYYRALLPACSVLFIATFILEEKIRKVYGYYNTSFSVNHVNGQLITFISQSILCLIFTYLILLINLKITLGNKVLTFLSSISIETFLIHNLFLKDIFNFTRVNVFFKFAIVLLCGIFAAAIMHLIDKPLILFFQKQSEIKAYLKAKRKPITIGLAAFLFCSTLILSCYTYIYRPYNDYKNELSNLKNAEIHDTVFFGRYEENTLSLGKEKVEWIVLDKKDNSLMLISKYGLDGSVYNNTHSEVSWDVCDLQKKLNTEMYNKIFSKSEKKIIKENPATNDYLSLLSSDEAMQFFSDDASRQLIITSAASKNGTNQNTPTKLNQWDFKDYHTSWWWLRSDSKDIQAPIVSTDGDISAKYVNKPNGAIRPVVWINLP